MQSVGEKTRGIIIIIIIFKHGLKKDNGSFFQALDPIYTVTSLAKGKGLPSECAFQLYLQPCSASGTFSKCAFSSLQLPVTLSDPTMPGSFTTQLTASPMCLVKLAGPDSQSPSAL